jgi:nitrite reductase/ring-hydroxylating ferredoxin subunit
MTGRYRLTDVETVHEEGSWLFTVLDARGEETEVVLVACEDGVEAWVNRCTHEAQSLYREGVGAVIRDEEVVCPKHGSTFDTCSGYCDNGPAAETTLPSVDVSVEDGQVYLTTNGDMGTGKNLIVREWTGSAFTEILRAGPSTFTYQGNTIWHAGNDGSGSGLDADLLDGKNSTAFVEKTGGTMTGTLTANGLQSVYAPTAATLGTSYPLGLSMGTVLPTDGWPLTGTLLTNYQSSIRCYQELREYGGSSRAMYRTFHTSTWSPWREYWHTENDGAGSGLDADLVDGYHATNASSAVNTVAVRNGAGDIHVRLLRTAYAADQGVTGNYFLTQNAAGSDTADNYARPTSREVVQDKLGTGRDWEYPGTGNFTAVNGRRYQLYSTSGQVIFLPANPARGWWVEFHSYHDTALNTVINRNGQNIHGLAQDMTLDTPFFSLRFIFDDSTRGWRLA